MTRTAQELEYDRYTHREERRGPRRKAPQIATSTTQRFLAIAKDKDAMLRALELLEHPRPRPRGADITDVLQILTSLCRQERDHRELLESLHREDTRMRNRARVCDKTDAALVAFARSYRERLRWNGFSEKRIKRAPVLRRIQAFRDGVVAKERSDGTKAPRAYFTKRHRPGPPDRPWLTKAWAELAAVGCSKAITSLLLRAIGVSASTRL